MLNLRTECSVLQTVKKNTMNHIMWLFTPKFCFSALKVYHNIFSCNGIIIYNININKFNISLVLQSSNCPHGNILVIGNIAYFQRYFFRNII